MCGLTLVVAAASMNHPQHREMHMSHVQVRYTDSYEEACALRDAGWEPVECAFGGHGSVLGPLAMDHHGTESHRPGVAIRAFGDAYGARAADPRFVVTGTPDADATLAIVGMAGLVELDLVPRGFIELVDLQDTAPIGLDLTTAPFGPWLLKFNQTQLPRGEKGFTGALDAMLGVLRAGVPNGELRHVLGKERSRMERANRAVLGIVETDGAEHPPEATPPQPPPLRVALVQSTVWGFDRWYLWAPVVVSHSTRLQKVTLGCPDRETAERLLGPGGLLAIYGELGKGWGGREAVGGSPRGVPMTLDDARTTAQRVAELLRAHAGQTDAERADADPTRAS